MRIFGNGRSSIKKWLILAEQKKTFWELSLNGLTLKEKTDGLTKNLKRIWTTTEIHVLEQMLLGKYTYAEIAKSLKRTECSITSKVHDLKKILRKILKWCGNEEEVEE